MKITLCGSARFEKEFKEMNERLSLAGHVVYSLAVYPSDKGGKDWYNDRQKEALDAVHLEKIDNSDVVYLIAPGGYIGESTQRELDYAKAKKKKILSQYPFHENGFVRTCTFKGCFDPTLRGPCALCYE